MRLTMKRHFFFFLALLPLLSQGQTVRKLKLEEAIKLGQEQSKALKISQSKMAIADAKYVEVKDMLVPSVNVSGGYARLSDITPFSFQLAPNTKPVTLFPVLVNDYTSRASVNESIFNGFRLKNGVLSQQYLLEASRLDYEKDKTEIIWNIVNAYYNLYKAQASRKLIEESLAQADERIKEIRNMEKQGLVIHNDVLRAELQRSNIELSEVDIKSNLEIANFNFGVMTGLTEGTLVEIDSVDLFRSRDMKKFQEYLQSSFDKRSDLKAADFRKQASEMNLKVVKGEIFPTVNVGANYYYANPNPRYIPPADAFHSTWDVGINLNWNLTSLYTTKHQADEARIMILQSSVYSEQLSDAIRMEVNQDFVNYQQSQKKLEVASRAVSQAGENYQTLQSKYNNSTALLSDLLDANVLLLQAKLNLTYARADAEIAYNHLLKSTGSNQ
jgi:outer membrane protein